MPTERDPVDPTEIVLRQIWKDFFDASLPLPVQPAAFAPRKDESTGISVFHSSFVANSEDIKSVISLEKRPQFLIAAIPVSDLIRLGLSAIPDPTPTVPGHAVIPELNSTLAKSDRTTCRRIQKEFAVIASRNIIGQPTP